MFTFNKASYLPKSSLRTKFGVIDNSILDEVQCFSLAISPSVEIAAFFGLIEKQIFLMNIPSLEEMK